MVQDAQSLTPFIKLVVDVSKYKHFTHGLFAGVVLVIFYYEYISPLINKEPEKPKRKYISKAVRTAVLERDSYTCQLCHSPVITNPDNLAHIDHIVPVSKGGTNDLDNLRCLCAKCNLQKGDKEDDTN